MCRLHGCRNPARVAQKNPSKYCCDEHGVEFMQAQFSRCRKPFQARTEAGQPQSQQQQQQEGPSTEQNASQSWRGTGQRNVDARPEDSSNSLAPGPTVHPGHRSFEGGAGSAYDYDDDNDDTSVHGKQKRHAEDEEEEEEEILEDPSIKGGVLSVAELKALVSFVSTASEFRDLGNEDSVHRYFYIGDSQHHYNHDTADFTAQERGLLGALRERRGALEHQQGMLIDREKLLGVVRQRAKTVLETLRRLDGKDEWKDICGYDSRLSWSDEEFDEWRLSEEGKSVLETGAFVVDVAMGDATDADGHGGGEAAAAADADRSSLTENVCLKRRCERHKQWVKVQQQDIAYESRVDKDDLDKCQQAIMDLMRRVRLRLCGAGLGEDRPVKEEEDPAIASAA